MTDLTSLITRARSASSLEEECGVIYDAVRAILPEGGKRSALLGLNFSTQVGDFPRSVLIGVVASLVECAAPTAEWGASKWSDDGGYGSGTVASHYARHECDAASPALSLLAALLTALQSREGRA